MFYHWLWTCALKQQTENFLDLPKITLNHNVANMPFEPSSIKYSYSYLTDEDSLHGICNIFVFV